MRSVDLLVPRGIADPAHPSGGNRYDRMLAAALADDGWVVRMVETPVAPPAAAADALAAALAALPDGATVLADGLVLAAAPHVAGPHAGRLRLVPLLHMAGPLEQGDAGRALLVASRAVITTSGWTRRQVLDSAAGAVPPVTVARPGVERAPLVAPSATGGRLRCVAALLRHKGQDVLLAALSGLTDLDWRCDLVGATDLDPGFTRELQEQAAAAGIADRIRFLGAQAGALPGLYEGADLLVVPSRTESYGMVIGEALACGIPVIASDTGGVREALGRVGDRLPGILVPPGDRTRLAAALRSWLTGQDVRDALTGAARRRRGSLGDWAATGRSVAAVLARVADEPDPARLRSPGRGEAAT